MPCHRALASGTIHQCHFVEAQGFSPVHSNPSQLLESYKQNHSQQQQLHNLHAKFLWQKLQ
jgi:hypothetical protein